MTLHHSAETIIALVVLSLALGLLALIAAGTLRRLDPVWRSVVLGAVILCALLAPVGLVYRAIPHHLEPVMQGTRSAEPSVLVPVPASQPRLMSLAIADEQPAIPRDDGTHIPAAWRKPVLIAGVIWSGGILLGLLHWGAALVQLERVRRTAVKRFRVRNVPVLESGRWDQPACAGAFRPWILLPAGLAEKLGPKRLRAVLLHESAHARHRDILWLHVQRFTRILHWWNPAVHLASRAFSLAREELCDRRVLAAGIPAADYAQYLLDAARQAAGRTLPASAGASASFLEARKRIQTLMKNPSSSNLPGARSRFITVLLSAAGLVTFVSLPARIAIAADPESPAPAAGNLPPRESLPASPSPSDTGSDQPQHKPTSIKSGSTDFSVSSKELSVDQAETVTFAGDVRVSAGNQMELKAEKVTRDVSGLIVAHHPAEIRMESGERVITSANGSISLQLDKQIGLKNCEIQFASGRRMKAPDGRITLTHSAGRVSIMGEVKNPGRMDLQADAPATLLDAIAEAGGLTQFAAGKKVRILRGDKVAGTYDVGKLTQDPALNPKLQAGDIVIVPVD